MTLGTIVEKLGALLAKPFLLGSFAPVLLFCLINGALLNAQNASFRSFADEYLWQTGNDPIRNTTLVFLCLLLTAFVFSMLNTRLREILEGDGWWEWLEAAFIRRQREIYEPLRTAYDSAHSEEGKIRDGRSEWLTRLQDARTDTSSPKRACSYSRGRAAAKKLDELRQLRRTGRIIPIDEIAEAVRLLEQQLLACTLDRPAKSPPVTGSEKKCADLLDQDHIDLLELAEYAETRLRDQAIEHHSNLKGLFPDDVIQPTAMGNIAGSVASYTRMRYGFNIDLLWSRLQKVMQADTFHGTVQDAKTQLDFLVSLLWLAGASVAGWLGFYLFFGYSRGYFLLVAVGGPIVMRTLYLLCLQNYKAFADLLRSAVDLYRFDLLEELHIALPEDSTQERNLWQVLDRRIQYGENISLPYKHGGS